MINVLNFFADAPITQGRLDELAERLFELWEQAILPFQCNTCFLREVTVRDLSTADSLTASYAAELSPTGGRPGDPLPLSVACCVTHRTARIGRSRRGRTYIGGLSENDTSVSTLSPVLRDGLETGFTALRAGLLVLGWQLVVLSREGDGQPRGQGLTTIVTASVVRNARTDSQRRRTGRD